MTNIGSPDEPTPKAVRRYLKKFLSDGRVVDIPSFIWYPILYGFILPFRSKKSASLYQKIWTTQGSPLTVLTSKLAEKLQQQLNAPVALGMHYGNPSIEHALENLRAQQVNKLIILPLYPQYSATTTAATFDFVANHLAGWKNIPALQFIHDYSSQPEYINAISKSIQQCWQTQGKAQHLLFSFHGIPKRGITQGDPYAEQCELSARLIATQLGLQASDWSLAYQSRLSGAWLTPFTDKILQELPKRGITDLQVICPGFAVDCLETLEEITMRGQEQFLMAGGKKFHYIPALNDSDEHIKMLCNILSS